MVLVVTGVEKNRVKDYQRAVVAKKCFTADLSVRRQTGPITRNNVLPIQNKKGVMQKGGIYKQSKSFICSGEKVADEGIILTERQIAELERKNEEDIASIKFIKYLQFSLLRRMSLLQNSNPSGFNGAKPSIFESGGFRFYHAFQQGCRNLKKILQLPRPAFYSFRYHLQYVNFSLFYTINSYTIYLSSRAVTPGRFLPSRNSREAPPPVET